jgi:hypothetical protein
VFLRRLRNDVRRNLGLLIVDAPIQNLRGLKSVSFKNRAGNRHFWKLLGGGDAPSKERSTRRRQFRRRKLRRMKPRRRQLRRRKLRRRNPRRGRLHPRNTVLRTTFQWVGWLPGALLWMPENHINSYGLVPSMVPNPVHE